MSTEKLLVEHDALRPTLDEALRLLGELVDPDDCYFDHNGDCQAHGTSGDGPCPGTPTGPVSAASDAPGGHWCTVADGVAARLAAADEEIEALRRRFAAALKLCDEFEVFVPKKVAAIRAALTGEVLVPNATSGKPRCEHNSTRAHERRLGPAEILRCPGPKSDGSDSASADGWPSCDR